MPKFKRIKLKRPNLRNQAEDGAKINLTNDILSKNNNTFATRQASWRSKPEFPFEAKFCNDNQSNDVLPHSSDIRWQPYGSRKPNNVQKAAVNTFKSGKDWVVSDKPKDSQNLLKNVVRSTSRNSPVRSRQSSGQNVDRANTCNSQKFDQEEPMEVDEVEIIKGIRQNFKIGIAKEKVTTTNLPEVVKSESKADIERVFIVVDTCAIIGKKNLSVLEDVFETGFKRFNYPFIIIPWVVVQELDFLKSNKAKEKGAHLKSAVVNGINFIHSQLTAKHPRLFGQSYSMADEAKQLLEVKSNDDEVLCCCLHYQKNHGRDTIVLLTNDKNLSSKAIISGIKCFSSENIEDEVSKIGAEKFKQQFADNWFKTPSSANLSAKTQPALPLGVTPASLKSKPKNIDKVISEMKSILKSFLSTIIEFECKEVYGEKLWLKTLPVKPPWKIASCLHVVNKLWIAVFGFVFPRFDQDAFKSMERYFLRSYDNNLQNVKEVLVSAICVLSHLKEKKPYSETLRQTIKKLENLSENCDQLSGKKSDFQPQKNSIRSESVSSVNTAHSHRNAKISDGIKTEDPVTRNNKIAMKHSVNTPMERDDVKKAHFNPYPSVLAGKRPETCSNKKSDILRQFTNSDQQQNFVNKNFRQDNRVKWSAGADLQCKNKNSSRLQTAQSSMEPGRSFRSVQPPQCTDSRKSNAVPSPTDSAGRSKINYNQRNRVPEQSTNVGRHKNVANISYQQDDERTDFPPGTDMKHRSINLTHHQPGPGSTFSMPFTQEGQSNVNPAFRKNPNKEPYDASNILLSNIYPNFRYRRTAESSNRLEQSYENSGFGFSQNHPRKIEHNLNSNYRNDRQSFTEREPSDKTINRAAQPTEPCSRIEALQAGKSSNSHQIFSSQYGGSADLQPECSVYESDISSPGETQGNQQLSRSLLQFPPAEIEPRELFTIQNDIETCFKLVWTDIKKYCGMILDGLNIPNSWHYSRPARLPTFQEILMFIPKLYKALKSLRIALKGVVENKVTEESCRLFYLQLHNFFINIDLASPPQMNCLSHDKISVYCQTYSLRLKLTEGLSRLREYQTILQKCMFQITDIMMSSKSNLGASQFGFY